MATDVTEPQGGAAVEQSFTWAEATRPSGGAPVPEA